MSAAWERTDDLDALGALAASPGGRIYIRPLIQAPDTVRPHARRVGGTGLAAADLEIIARHGDRVLFAPLVLSDIALDWADEQPASVRDAVFTQARAFEASSRRFLHFALDRPLLMGIVNVTPDSFSDGGVALEPGRALARIEALVAAGADIIDIGAESTRPGAAPVDARTEIERLTPVFAALGGRRDITLSIDTRHPETMGFALAHGAAIVNDVSALTEDPASLDIVAGSGAGVVLMHKQGDPATMNDAPAYADPVLDVYDHLEARIAVCRAAGIVPRRILVDPGIGFGKATEHSLAVLRRLSLLHSLGCGILLGVSRKGLLGDRDEVLPPRERLPGSLAAMLWGVSQGVQAFRVHDVAEARLALDVWSAVGGRGPVDFVAG